MSNKNDKSDWTLPDDYKNYFKPSSDEEFEANHPIGYNFLAILGIIALILPAFIFWVLTGADDGWGLLGVLGGFIFGIGLFNFLGIIIKQYLGHLVSIMSFLIGGILMLISWFLCR